jgi:hypothetical protein
LHKSYYELWWFRMKRATSSEFPYSTRSLISYHFSHDYYFSLCAFMPQNLRLGMKSTILMIIASLLIHFEVNWTNDTRSWNNGKRREEENFPCRLLVNTFKERRMNFKIFILLNLPLFMQTLNFHIHLHDYRTRANERARFMLTFTEIKNERESVQFCKYNRQ